MKFSLEPKEICERYKKLYSGCIYDLLEERGLPNQALSNEIKPLAPDMVVAGFAFTVRGAILAEREEAAVEKRIRLLEEMRPYSVEVRDCGRDDRAAHYGELSATAARAAGAVGAVIDGGNRDSSYVLKMGFPVFCRYRNPVESMGRWGIIDYQIPISLRGALSGSVRINPGDFIFGDIDGVVVIPRELTEEILFKAEELMARETEARMLLKKGASPRDVYQKFGRF